MIKKDENKFNVSRRSFLRTAALTSAAFCASPVINKTEAAEKKQTKPNKHLSALSVLWVRELLR